MAPAHRSPAVLIFVLWLAGLGAAGQFAKISLIFPELLALYPGHGTWAGLLVTLISFMGVALGLFTGMIVARFGFRKPLLAALLLGGAISAAQATLPSFSAMLALRLAEGISHLLIVVAAPTLIARVSSDQHRALAMTLWGTFFGVAFALTGLLGLPLVRAYGIPALFIAHASLMIGVAVLLHIMLPRAEVQSGALAGITWRGVVARHAETYSSAFTAAPALGWLFYTLSFVSLLTVLPGLLPDDQRSLAATLMPLAGIATSLVIGVALLRRTPAVQVVKSGFLLAGVCILAFAAPRLATASAIAMFCALGLVQGATFASIAQLNPDPRGQTYANGALAQMGNLGNLAGTVVVLSLIEHLGRNGVVLFGLACFAGGFLIHSLLERRRSLATHAGHR